jgi:UDP-N-acetyl-D-galactosamine dehydrogenase
MTFKENVPDIRNSRVIDIVHELESFAMKVDVWEPVADPLEVKHEYGLTPIKSPKRGAYDAVVLAVKHAEFLKLGKKGLMGYLKKGGVFYDVKETMNG